MNFCLQACLSFLNTKMSIYRLREVLEALVNLDNLEVSLPVQLEVRYQNRIRPDLRSYIARRFWYSKRPN
jgi:hypothetical protein